MFVLGDNREKWAVGVIGRALESYGDMRIIRNPIQQCLAYPRLADAGLATQQNNLTFAALGAFPQAVQLAQLVLPSDEPRKLLRTDRSEAAFAHSFTQDPPRSHWLGKSLEVERSKLLTHEHIAQQSLGASGHDRRVGGCHALQVEC